MKKFCATAAFALLTAAVGFAGAPIPEGLGLNIHYNDARREIEMFRGPLSVTMVRVDVRWSEMEKVKGEYDFAQYDEVVKVMEENGVKGVMIFDYTNKLYDDNLPPHSEEGLNAYANWAAACVKRYAGKGHVWEIWNEPNEGRFWKPKPNAELYAQLAIHTSKAIRAAAPGEMIAGPALSHIDLPWAEEIFRRGVLEHLDAVSVHPYRWREPETMVGEYRELRRLIAQYAPAGKQISVIDTEQGYTSTEVPIEKHGMWLPRMWLIERALGVDLNIMYAWRDDGIKPQDREDNFGLVKHEFKDGENPPYTPKPAFYGVRTLLQQLDGLSFDKRIDLGDEKLWLLMFKGTKGQRLVGWSMKGEHKVKLPLAGSFAVTNHLGENLSGVTGSADGMEFTLTEGPVYFAPEQGNAFAAVLAGWSTLENVHAFQAPGQLSAGTTFTNTTGAELIVRDGGTTVTLAPGQVHEMKRTYMVERSQKPLALSSELKVEGYPELRQSALATAVNPLELELRPAVAGKVSVRVKNRVEQPLEATLEIAPGKVAPLVFQKGQLEAVVEFSGFGPGAYSIDPIIRQGDTVLLDPPARRYLPIELTAESFDLVSDTNDTSGFSLAIKPPAEGLPAGAQASEVSYDFTTGQRSMRLVPREPLVVEGKPYAVGIWILNNNSKNWIRTRLIDATGQAFQPFGVVLEDFAGWKYHEYVLEDLETAYWSGANDGKVHGPVRFDSFILDRGPRKEVGSVQLAAPAIIYQD